MKSWYLLFAKPREEERAKRNLECQGVSVYYPRIEVQKIKNCQKVISIEPLFPRYIFVCIEDCPMGFSTIRSTRGVANIIRFNGQLAKVPNSLINSLRAREKGNHSILAYPKPGDKVRINKGAFKGVEAVVYEENSESRVILLMNIMSQKTKITANYSDISAL